MAGKTAHIFSSPSGQRSGKPSFFGDTLRWPGSHNVSSTIPRWINVEQEHGSVPDPLVSEPWDELAPHPTDTASAVTKAGAERADKVLNAPFPVATHSMTRITSESFGDEIRELDPNNRAVLRVASCTPCAPPRSRTVLRPCWSSSSGASGCGREHVERA
jgi:hypothetical protein